MPVTLHCDTFPLTASDVEKLWQLTRAYRQFPDEEIAVACVSEEKIQSLNNQYRGKDTPTNVLTFSYDTEHDVAVCSSVIEAEAAQRSVSITDYFALVLVHAFLHVVGMDHEASPAAAIETEAAERAILEQAGLTALSL